MSLVHRSIKVVISGIIIMLVGVAFAATSVFSLIPIVCAELFGKEKVQSAMAINLVYQGLANIVSTFSAGEILYYIQ